MKISISKLKLKRKEYKGITKKSGRNHSGKITVFTKGGGHKNSQRILNNDWKHRQGLLVAVEYDPKRTALLGKFWDVKLKKFYYDIYPQGLKLFSNVTSHFNKKQSSLNIGDHASLKFFDVGDFVHNLEFKPYTGAKIAKSAGTFAQIIQKVDYNTLENNSTYKDYIRVKLPSREQRWFLKDCRATLGIVGNEDFKNKKLIKAGQSRWLGKRPVVRGVAMNPIDHPHGGGEGKTSGGRPSVSPWGKLTKGVSTRKKKKTKFYIFERRSK